MLVKWASQSRLRALRRSACFPDQWINARRAAPDSITIAPLANEIREYHQTLAAAIRQGTLIPLAHVANTSLSHVSHSSWQYLTRE